MKRILVTSDLSVRSDRALGRAIQLAKDHGAALSVLHVVDDDLPPSVVETLSEAARGVLSQTLEAAGAGDTQVEIRVGPVVETITTTAEELDAELLVMGVHKARAFWDMVSGTTMERAVRALTRPVLLVAQPANGPYASVLCGLDLSPASAAAARTAARLAPKARLTAFHAVHIPYRGLLGNDDTMHDVAPFLAEAETELAAWWRGADLPAGLERPTPTADDVGHAFEIARLKSGADLFALGAHGRPAFAPTRLGGFAEHLLRHPVCDVLVVRR